MLVSLITFSFHFLFLQKAPIERFRVASSSFLIHSFFSFIFFAKGPHEAISCGFFFLLPLLKPGLGGVGVDTTEPRPQLRVRGWRPPHSLGWGLLEPGNPGLGFSTPLQPGFWGSTPTPNPGSGIWLEFRNPELGWGLTRIR